MTLAQAAGDVTTAEAVVFWILAPIALGGAIAMVAARNAVHSALFLVVTMCTLAVFYVLQAGPFIGMVQIIVYTGAIMMLFLFVLMLVGRDASDSLIETLRGQRMAAIALGIGFAALVASALARGLGSLTVQGLDQANAGGNVEGIAAVLFTRYVFAFEVTSALLITAAVGAMVLAHVERPKGTKVGQKQRSRARFAAGSYPGMKAGPGVFAGSDSVATPALLPDGTTAGRSISPVVPERELTASESAPKHTER
ncbi:MAG: NADH-quinone oxidoreductase subunit J [Micromonosporaceae bacterium]